MQNRRGWFWTGVVGGALVLTPVLLGTGGVTACGKDTGTGVLEPQDLAAPDGGDGKFDPNNIIDPAAFTDTESKGAADVQKFLHRDAYDTASFLETYQSNGIRASDAIAAAALNYHINPIVFLVFAEMTQGLVGATEYPFPPERVEYVFRCGCFQAGNCLGNLAGFDRQVDCLGRELRTALDQVKNSQGQKTDSGWGPTSTSTTLDDVQVKPANDATAVLYDRLGKVAQGKPGGTWLFWNIWQFYTPKFDYSGPVGAIDGRWVGEACAVDTACGFDKALCAQNGYPGGLCTAPCTSDSDCPKDPNKGDSVCAKFKSSGGFCFKTCNAGSASCRPKYKCGFVAVLGSDTPVSVCEPDPAQVDTSSNTTTNTTQ